MGNCAFKMMLRYECALAVENFVAINWWGEKTLADLEGEDWCEVWDFQEKLRELSGEDEEE